MSNSASLSEEATVSSGTRVQNFTASDHVVSTIQPQQPQKIKRKRSLPGNPDPDAEVIALSPKTLLATNRYVCEICNKGFQRDQNLQLHRRGHNLPWKLKQRNSKEVKKKVYVCPEPSCVHNNPSRALGDLTGIKKHYCRKHGEKKWKCHRCSKIYAVQSDWKAHSKTCGTREYRCDCGTLFSRKDSFITHRAFCDVLAEESARFTANQLTSTNPVLFQSLFPFQNQILVNSWDASGENPNPSNIDTIHIKTEAQCFQVPTPFSSQFLQVQQENQKNVINPFSGTLHVPSNAATSAHLSATALLQKAANVGPTSIAVPGAAAAADGCGPQSTMGHVTQPSMGEYGLATQQIDSGGHDCIGGLMTWNQSERLTRDFLGLTADVNGGSNGDSVDVGLSARDMLIFTGGVECEYLPYDHHQHSSLFKCQQDSGFFGTVTAPETWGTLENS
ncbi:protein indeterminate-domain 12-like [Prosopis cineraria]|uniref:protein indeterminate-domain 12-like n=1 Tax=Prosopis cineraria TaxID=364024 RepID=UPI0024101F66|nr:protein indeterminate-domain 12-like [Prosopis cineraria]